MALDKIRTAPWPKLHDARITQSDSHYCHVLAGNLLNELVFFLQFQNICAFTLRLVAVKDIHFPKTPPSPTSTKRESFFSSSCIRHIRQHFPRNIVNTMIFSCVLIWRTQEVTMSLCQLRLHNSFTFELTKKMKCWVFYSRVKAYRSNSMLVSV